VSRNTPVVSRYRNLDKLWLDGPLGSDADLMNDFAVSMRLQLVLLYTWKIFYL